MECLLCDEQRPTWGLRVKELLALVELVVSGGADVSHLSTHLAGVPWCCEDWGDGRQTRFNDSIKSYHLLSAYSGQAVSWLLFIYRTQCSPWGKVDVLTHYRQGNRSWRWGSQRQCRSLAPRAMRFPLSFRNLCAEYLESGLSDSSHNNCLSLLIAMAISE